MYQYIQHQHKRRTELGRPTVNQMDIDTSRTDLDMTQLVRQTDIHTDVYT